jgi:hypothetical protein
MSMAKVAAPNLAGGLMQDGRVRRVAQREAQPHRDQAGQGLGGGPSSTAKTEDGHE